MLETPELNRHLRLPWPGLDCTQEEKDAGVAPRMPSADDPCRNVWQSVGWWRAVQSLAAGDPQWAPGGCNIALSLNVDGFQPFKRGGVTLTPMSCMILNLPENLRHRADHMMLAGIIGKREPSDMNDYMNFLVNEQIKLDADGVEFTDPFRTNDDGSKVMGRAKVRLLFTSADYPAHTKVNKQRTAASKYGCHKCDVEVSIDICDAHARINARYRCQLSHSR